MTQARHHRCIVYNIVWSCIGPDFVALPTTQAEEPGSLIRAGTKQSGCVLEIRGGDERSSTTEQHETLLEQHQGHFLKSHKHNGDADKHCINTECMCAYSTHAHKTVFRHIKQTFPNNRTETI